MPNVEKDVKEHRDSPTLLVRMWNGAVAHFLEKLTNCYSVIQLGHSFKYFSKRKESMCPYKDLSIYMFLAVHLL